MSRNLRERAEDTAQEVQKILGRSNKNHPKEVADAIEHAIINALVEERQRCADVARICCADDAEKAKHVSEEIARVKSVLISNLSSMR
jgi:predicted Zn-ribbon and HTH transcriptional regulator